MDKTNIHHITIRDELSLQKNGAIEVTIQFVDGKRRLCYFMTTEALNVCGDWIDGTRIRFHYGNRYTIIISEILTEDIILKALYTIEHCCDIQSVTMPLDEAEISMGNPAEYD